MARTATAVNNNQSKDAPGKQQQLVEREKAPKAIAKQQPQPDYHYIKRAIGPNSLPDGTVTGDQIDAVIGGWLERGYKILAVHFVGQHKDNSGTVLADQFVYHLVKDA